MMQTATDPHRRFWQATERDIATARARGDLAFLSNIKREILDTIKDNPETLEYAKVSLVMLDGVPDEVRCDCCGQQLKSSFQRRSPDGAILTLGSECLIHELGACRR
jgi:hypothetical protein